jgi:hypothetical protein
VNRSGKFAVALVLMSGSAPLACNALLDNGYGVDDSAFPGTSPEGSSGDALVEGSSGGDANVSDGSTGDGTSSSGDGGGCPNNVCPTMLASAPGAQRLAVSATTVYWAFASGAGRVGLNGGAPTTLPLGAPIAPGLERGIAVEPVSGAPYVTMPGNLRGAAKCTVDLTSCTTTGFIGSAGDVSSIVVTAANAFVGVFDDQIGGAGGVWRTNLDGTSPTPYTMMTDKVLDLQIAGATTYFRTSVAVQANTLTTMPHVAGDLAGDAPLAFVVQGSRLIVATTNNHLRACTLSPPGTCAAAIIQTTSGAPSAVTADSVHVFWSEGGAGGSVHRCDLPDCANPVLLATGQASPSDIAVDGTAIYWANHGDNNGSGGAIMKLPK